MDALKIAAEERHFCPYAGEFVSIEEAKLTCALKHQCEPGRPCDLYVERLIYQTVKKHGACR